MSNDTWFVCDDSGIEAKPYAYANDAISVIQNSYIPIDCQELPLLNAESNEYVINKHVCPLCGGGLKPMGWFRESGIKEMLHKCTTCGLAVFRDVV